MAKASPTTGYREYRAESDAEFPFHKVHKGKKSEKMKGPSGSTWELPQLNWLGTDHQIGCDLKTIAPEDRGLAPFVTKYIDEHLSMTWRQISAADKEDLNDFYINLRALLLLSKQPPPLSAKVRIGPARASSSILDSSGMPDHRANADRHYVDLDLLPPLSAMSDSSLSDEEPQLPPLPLETMSAEEKKKAKKDRKDKDEKDVEHLAGSFMNMIGRALDVDKDLVSNTSSPDEYVFEVKNRRIKVKHDVSMKNVAWKTNKTQQQVPIVTQVYTECKRQFHKKKPAQIQGQILAELLAAATRAADVTQGAKPQKTYTIYLISWHHVLCFISRLDIQSSDLDRLKKGDRHCLLGLCVKETRRYDMVLPEERIQVAELVALIAINRLALYQSLQKSKLIGRLRGPRPQGI